MRYANHIELQRDMQQMAREARDLAAKARKLEAENKRLRKHLDALLAEQLRRAKERPDACTEPRNAGRASAIAARMPH